jgi:hypothetical protein
MFTTTEERKNRFRFDLSESVEFVGRTAELAAEYGFTDVDGRVVPLVDPKSRPGHRLRSTGRAAPSGLSA